MFPTTKCSKYLNCGEEGHANIKDCNITQPGTIFNISSRQCVEDTTPPCKGKYNTVLCFVIRLVQATRKISMTNFYTKYEQGGTSQINWMTHFLLTLIPTHLFLSSMYLSCHSSQNQTINLFKNDVKYGRINLT